MHVEAMTMPQPLGRAGDVGLADALAEKFGGIAMRIVLDNALADPQRIERYGEVARRLRC
jgi:hypothetical protein